MTTQPVESPASSLENALCDRLQSVGWTGTRTTPDLQTLVAQHGAVARVNEVPSGTANHWQRVARVRVELFAPTYDSVRDKAQLIRDLLLVGRGFRASGWVIDRVRCESDFAEVPHSEGIRYMNAIFRVTTRSRAE